MQARKLAVAWAISLAQTGILDAKPMKRHWSERGDSNSRPLAPEASALPGCATLRPTVYLNHRMPTSTRVGNPSSQRVLITSLTPPSRTRPAQNVARVCVRPPKGSRIARRLYSGTPTREQVRRTREFNMRERLPSFTALTMVRRPASPMQPLVLPWKAVRGSTDPVFKVLGRSQVVRQRILIPPFGGSNPPVPASFLYV
jgi:hypothetical protein